MQPCFTQNRSAELTVFIVKHCILNVQDGSV